MKANYIEAEYIESGAFQGGEEDASIIGIKYGETVVIMRKSTLAAIKKELGQAKSIMLRKPRT